MRGRVQIRLLERGSGTDILNHNFSSSLLSTRHTENITIDFKREHGESRLENGREEILKKQEIRKVFFNISVQDTDFCRRRLWEWSFTIPLSRIHNGRYLGLASVLQALENAMQRVDRRGGICACRKFHDSIARRKRDLVCFFPFSSSWHEQIFISKKHSGSKPEQKWSFHSRCLPGIC